MMHDYFEDFILLTKSSANDGVGGAADVYTDGTAFRGGLYRESAYDTAAAGQRASAAIYRLLFDASLPITQETRIKRAADGAIFRAIEAPEMAPVAARVRYSYVRLERVTL